MMWSGSLVKWIDELACYVLLLTGITDCVFNRRFKAYLPMLTVMAVMTFYVVYSTFKGFNTLPYIAMDAIISLKPFVPFMVLLAVRPVPDAVERNLIKALAIVNVAEVIVLYAMPFMREYKLSIHIMYLGATCMVAAMSYYLFSIDRNGKVSKPALAVVITFLVIGLGCTRAKYYAEAVLAVFLFLLYKPGMFRGVKPGYWALGIMLIGIVAAVSWHKFSYYFITGNSDTFDPTVAESFARPVLYATGGLILVDHFPFGSGLASFASYASQAHYSSLYHDYGISSVYGLSEAMPDFICDAFYPMLAQYGVVGIVLFAAFMVWATGKVRTHKHSVPHLYCSHMAVCLAVTSFILIEGIAGTLPMQSWGMIAMMIMAMVAVDAPLATQAPSVTTPLTANPSPYNLRT